MSQVEDQMSACDFHGSSEGGGHAQETCGDCIKATEDSMSGASHAPAARKGKPGRKVIS